MIETSNESNRFVHVKRNGGPLDIFSLLNYSSDLAWNVEVVRQEFVCTMEKSVWNANFMSNCYHLFYYNFNRMDRSCIPWYNNMM